MATLATPASCGSPAPTPPPSLRADQRGSLDAALARLGRAEVSISIGAAGREIYGAHSGRALVPASNQKLWTAAGAQLLLPPDFSFDTRVYAAGARAGGVLDGDLVIVGGGDPTLTTTGALHSLDSLAKVVRAAGIEHVSGRVVIDESRWDLTRTPSGWEPQQLEFVGPLSAFMVDWNNLRKDVEFMNDPAVENGRTLVKRLAAAGVTVAGGVAAGRVPGSAQLVHTERSGTLDKLLSFLLSESDNMMAEAFVREIGLKIRNSPTHTAGLAAIEEAIHTKLCLPSEGINDDGSGVSKYSRHSAAYFRVLLELLPEMRGRLGVSGQTGTMKNRLKNVTGKVQAKTGTVNGARTLSGYVTAASGREFTFSILVNGNDADLTSKALDDFVETLATGF